MANANPYHGRQANKKKYRKPGNLDDLLKVVWNALLEAQAVLDSTDGDNPELALKAVHAVSQCAGQYSKLLEIGELEARLSALEATIGGKR